MSSILDILIASHYIFKFIASSLDQGSASGTGSPGSRSPGPGNLGPGLILKSGTGTGTQIQNFKCWSFSIFLFSNHLARVSHSMTHPWPSGQSTRAQTSKGEKSNFWNKRNFIYKKIKSIFVKLAIRSFLRRRRFLRDERNKKKTFYKKSVWYTSIS